MTTTDPVLIAGAGPVGMVAALLLARHGVPSVVLEANAAREPVGSKSICIQRDVLDVYRRIGVAEALVAEGVYWQRARTYYREHELFQTTFPTAGRSAFPPWINLGQQRVEHHLANRVTNEPLVELRHDHRIVAVSAGADGVTVRCATATGSVELTGSHLLAADGAHSSVRGLLGIDFPGRSYGDLFLIADIRVTLPFPAERRFYFDPPWNPGRQVLVHPQPDSVWRIDWQVPDDFDLAADRDSGRLDERIRSIAGTAPYELVWLSVYRFHQRLADRFAVGRVLLAGDAAHLMAPFGARGLNSGVHDAENAAWKIAFHRQGWAGPGLLRSYQAERRAAAEDNLRVTGATMRFLVPQDDAERAHRLDVLRRAVTEPAARAEVDSGKLAEPYWYLDSPLTTGTPPAEFPVEPGRTRPPVPGVLCPDGPVAVAGQPWVTRLRELFGTRPVLLYSAPEVSIVDARIPLHQYRLPAIDSEGVLTAALDARPGRAYLIRPDGHLAAVLDRPDPASLAAALRRACGHPDPGGPADGVARLSWRGAAP